MSALKIWLQTHNQKMSQEAIDEALMEYITHVEKQRDELLADMVKAREEMACANFNSAAERIDHAIARVKGGAA